MAPKRGRDDDDKSGPSKVQLRGLAWNESAAKPAFLRNALAALQGPKPARQDLGADSGRPPIPERPEGQREAAGDDDEESDEDEWDMGRGEEAPAVVVLKEGKHIDREEVDRIRREAKASGSTADPFATVAASASTKSTGSLNFSSSTSKAGSSSKAKSSEAGTESWDDVIQRSKADAAAKALKQERQAQDEAKSKEKEKKRKAKEKKQNAKKIGMLSFDE